jgi:CRISPR-associated protein Cas2
MSTWVVSYDVSNDQLRGRIARCLEDYGRRVQYSVFECDIDQRDFDSMVKALQREMRSAEAGDLRLYRICERCVEASLRIGLEEPERGRSCRII